MDPEVQAFVDKWTQRVEAKRAADGTEGALFDGAQALADAYVEAHPEQFTSFEQYVTPESHDLLVQMIDLMRANGREEEVVKLTMFELARFERQNIGQRIRAVVRR